MERSIGQTKDSSFQFGIRKTYPISHEKAWDLLFSPEGLKIWLGELQEALELKQAFKSKAGVEGFVRVLNPYSHIRMNWKKPEWEHFSILQIRVIENKGKATVSCHQEKLQDLEQRKVMKAHWSAIIEALSIFIRSNIQDKT